MNIKPQGLKMIVKVLPKREDLLPTGIIIAETVNADLAEGEVISISDQLQGVLNIGDVVLFPSKKGLGQYIEREYYIWLDAEAGKEEVWGVIPKEKFKQDKQDSL